jgi:sterol 14-demethylase
MGLQQLAGPYAVPVAIVVGFAAITSSLFIYLFGRPQLPKNAPQQASDQMPIVGAWSFFSKRCKSRNRRVNAHGSDQEFPHFWGLRHISRMSLSLR